MQTGEVEVQCEELEVLNMCVKELPFQVSEYFKVSLFKVFYISCKRQSYIYLFIWVLTSLSTHCIGHITTGSFMGRGNQYILLVKVLYGKLLTNSKQLPAFPHIGPGIERGGRRECYDSATMAPEGDI